jgi:uncharacterized protein YcaQ
MTHKLSIQMAPNVMLAAQGLDRPRDQPATKADVLEAIRRMGLLQIDTIHVVARSPYLVLWSRLAEWHGTPDVVIRQSDPPQVAALLKAAV